MKLVIDLEGMEGWDGANVSEIIQERVAWEIKAEVAKVVKEALRGEARERVKALAKQLSTKAINRLAKETMQNGL